MKPSFAGHLSFWLFLSLLLSAWHSIPVFAGRIETPTVDAGQPSSPETAALAKQTEADSEPVLETSIDALMEGSLSPAEGPVIPPSAKSADTQVGVFKNWASDKPEIRNHEKLLEAIHAAFLGLTDITQAEQRPGKKIADQARAHLSKEAAGANVTDYMVLSLSYASSTVFGAHADAFEVASRIGAESESSWKYYYPKETGNYKTLVLYQGDIEETKLNQIASEYGSGMDYR